MNRHQHPYSYLPILLAAALLTAATARASIDSFLQDVKFAENAAGVSNALAKVEARLQRGDMSAEDKARCHARQGELLARSNRRREALRIIREQVITAPGVSAATRLAGVDIIHSEWTRPYSTLPKLEILECALLAAQQPEFAKPSDTRGQLFQRIGKLHADRSFHDLAFAAYRKAAAEMTDPTAKVNAYFAAAASAQRYRDLKGAAECLAEASAIPNISTLLQQRILLARARNASSRDQHSWQPPRELVEKARGYAEEALHPRSPLIGTSEAILTLFSIARAKAASGDPAGGARDAAELIARKVPLDGWTKGDIAVFVADNLYLVGDYKEAVKYYEIAAQTGCTLGFKRLHKRIATTARAGRDYLRAMQGYGDSIKYCDKVEGKDEIAHLTKLVTLMNKAVRKGSSSVDATAIFSDSNPDLEGISLEE